MKESLRVVVAQALSFGLQVLFLLMSARVLGPDAQGMYGVARTCAYLIETFMWFGLTSGVTHLVASDFQRYHGPLVFLATTYLLGWILLSLPFVLWVLPSYGIATETGTLVFVWVGTIAATQLFNKIFIGQQRYALYNAAYLLTSAASFLPFWWMLQSGGISFHGVIWCNIFANLLGIVFSIVAHRTHLAQIEVLGRVNKRTIADFFVVGIKGYVSSLGFLLLYRADFFIVGYLAPRALGIYTVAVFVGEAIQKVPDWLGLALVPKVSAGQDDDGNLTRRFLLASCSFVSVVAALLGLASLVEFRYLEAVLGSDYYNVELYVLALMPKALIHCFIATYGARLAGHAYTLYHPAAGIIAFVALVFVDMTLFQFLGISAAFTGITVAYALAALILVSGARRQTRGVKNITLREPARS